MAPCDLRGVIRDAGPRRADGGSRPQHAPEGEVGVVLVGAPAVRVSFDRDVVGHPSDQVTRGVKRHLAFREDPGRVVFEQDRGDEHDLLAMRHRQRAVEQPVERDRIGWWCRHRLEQEIAFDRPHHTRAFDRSNPFGRRWRAHRPPSQGDASDDESGVGRVPLAVRPEHLCVRHLRSEGDLVRDGERSRERDVERRCSQVGPRRPTFQSAPRTRRSSRGKLRRSRPVWNGDEGTVARCERLHGRACLGVRWG